MSPKDLNIIYSCIRPWISAGAPVSMRKSYVISNVIISRETEPSRDTYSMFISFHAHGNKNDRKKISCYNCLTITTDSKNKMKRFFNAI